MKTIRFYLLPIIIGSLAGVLTQWGFDSFENNGAKYFAVQFLKSLASVSVIVILLNLARKKE